MGKHFHHAALSSGALLLSAFLGGCFEDTSTGPKRETDIRFPLAVGNTWVYRSAADRMTISAGDTTREAATGDVTWTITARETILGIDAYRMQITQHVLSGPDSGKTFTFNDWYAEQDSVLLAVANEDTATQAPFTMAQLFKPASPSNEISDWGVTVLVYPLTTGREWCFLPQDEYDKKVVEARETIDVRGRRFDTFRIVRNVDTRSHPGSLMSVVLTCTQWFSSVGLVKNTISSAAFQDTVTYHDTDILELISYSLK